MIQPKLILRSISLSLMLSSLLLVACSSSDDDDSDMDTATETDETDSDSDSDETDTDGTDSELSATEASNAFLDLLTDEELSTALLDFTDAEARTTWSNLPIIGPTGAVERNGLQFSDLSDDALAAAITVAESALSEAGYADFVGVRAADDFLNAASDDDGLFSSGNYFIAMLGEPSDDGDWMLQLGGHHMAWNITYLAGTGYPVPAFIAVEPQGEFEVDGVTYDPITDEVSALVAMFDALSTEELSNAFLTGETYSSVLVGPDEGSGVLPTDSYPTAGNRGGVFVSALTDAQQDVVIAAIETYVSDYPADVSDALLAEYTSDEAFADTLIAWAGTEEAGVDIDISGNYMRIDGPRLWIELVSQNGFVFDDETHFHSIYRDKEFDYGNSL